MRCWQPARARLAALAALPATEPAQALKQVSILLLDVVGSTRLSQQFDPEANSVVQLNPLSFALGLLPSPVGTDGAGSPEETQG
jgi:hypothetical protein